MLRKKWTKISRKTSHQTSRLRKEARKVSNDFFLCCVGYFFPSPTFNLCLLIFSSSVCVSGWRTKSRRNVSNLIMIMPFFVIYSRVKIFIVWVKLCMSFTYMLSLSLLVMLQKFINFSLRSRNLHPEPYSRKSFVWRFSPTYHLTASSNFLFKVF